MENLDTCPHCGKVIVLGNLPAGTIIKSREDIFDKLVNVPNEPMTYMSVDVTVTAPDKGWDFLPTE